MTLQGKNQGRRDLEVPDDGVWGFRNENRFVCSLRSSFLAQILPSIWRLVFDLDVYAWNDISIASMTSVESYPFLTRDEFKEVCGAFCSSVAAKELGSTGWESIRLRLKVGISI